MRTSGNGLLVTQRATRGFTVFPLALRLGLQGIRLMPLDNQGKLTEQRRKDPLA